MDDFRHRRGLIEVEMVASPIEEPDPDPQPTPSESDSNTSGDSTSPPKDENVEALQPKEPSKSLITMHAWLMMISWCILCVMGLVMSRLARHWKNWMELHMACEFGATILSMVGEIFAFTYSEVFFDDIQQSILIEGED